MVLEKSLDFKEDIFNIRGNVYLSGYWQSYKYFKDIKELLKRDFLLRQESNNKNVEMADKIVIAPKQWSKHTYINIDDLLPKTWIRF